MPRPEFHKMYPDQYLDAHLEAVGAIIGWCGGKGEDPPYLTPVLKEAYEHATAAAFNAGVALGRTVAA